jgi:hypothetical protein
MRQLARTLRRRTGVAMGEVDRLTGEVAHRHCCTCRGFLFAASSCGVPHRRQGRRPRGAPATPP